jgi:hypothetical protein
MPTELRFACTLAAPLNVVWERAVAVDGANDELWPLAKMTLPLRLGSHTPPEDVVGRQLHTWMLAFGFVPIDRRTMQIEVFEEGRFRECSKGLLQGRMCHERTAVAADDGCTVLTDILVFESRGRLPDAILRRGITMTFRRRHRRLRGHFDKQLAKLDGA